MEIDSEIENEILRDLARVQLSKFETSSDESPFPGEDMDKDPTEPLLWTNPPTREARELIVAEEILRFATITDRPVTSFSRQVIQATPVPTSEAVLTSTKITDTVTEHLTANGKSSIDETPALTKAPSKAIHIASEAGTSSLQPCQSASFGVSPPLVTNVQDAYYPVSGAIIPAETQQNTCPQRLPVFRPNTIPVTNRILAAIAQNELAPSASNSPLVLQPTSTADMSQFWPRTNQQLFEYFLENLRFIQGSDFSRPSSPDSDAPIRCLSPALCTSVYNSLDEISSVKQSVLLTTGLEEMVANKLQKIKDGVETDEGENKDHSHATTEEEPKVVDIYENNADQGEVIIPQQGTSGMNGNGVIFEDNLDLNLEDPLNEIVLQPEYPEEYDSSGAEWTRPEKRRLGIVMRELSREMKTKELQKKKIRLLKKGRAIAQAIENKICEIDQEITSVNRKTLRQIALPLDQTQEYDWVKVASVLNARRTPEDCRTHWEWFLHPSINTGEWTLIEVRALEIIAQRHNFRNWDDIAKELNTGRSGYQCFSYFRENLCPHLELRGQRNHE